MRVAGPDYFCPILRGRADYLYLQGLPRPVPDRRRGPDRFSASKLSCQREFHTMMKRFWNAVRRAGLHRLRKTLRGSHAESLPSLAAESRLPSTCMTQTTKPFLSYGALTALRQLMILRSSGRVNFRWRRFYVPCKATTKAGGNGLGERRARSPTLKGRGPADYPGLVGCSW